MQKLTFALSDNRKTHHTLITQPAEKKRHPIERKKNGQYLTDTMTKRKCAPLLQTSNFAKWSTYN